MSTVNNGKYNKLLVSRSFGTAPTRAKLQGKVVILQIVPGYLGNTPYRCVPNELPIERKAVAVSINSASTVVTDRLWCILPISPICRDVTHFCFVRHRQQRL